MKELTYVKIRESQESLSTLGDIGYRPLFGGYSLFVDGVIFAMVSGGDLYLRACEQCSDYFTKKSAPALQYFKRGVPIQLNYYRVDDELWQDTNQLIKLSSSALKSARQEKLQRNSLSRLKDLPNISLNLEIMLREAGINDSETLKSFGAKRSWIKLKNNKKAVGVKVLLALAGAISGVHEAVLPSSVRLELMDWWRRYEQRHSS
ncbi:TfoX/Sxy family DNA transformation protein [uncultured Cedecea sp.]|uniref:TfoX/Sxy family DNA transformation protein n=1 Tax=uncultured Cedecea sp. TaxID=988762 RepID=UPI0026125F2B|nr:TfoX/Sxy family DNA transformation protein [uncultured Cedecea sp.]